MSALGQKADMAASPCHVRFTPKSGRLASRQCPLCVNSGHWPVLFDHFVGRDHSLCSLPLAGVGGQKSLAARSHYGCAQILYEILGSYSTFGIAEGYRNHRNPAFHRRVPCQYHYARYFGEASAKYLEANRREL